MQTAAMSDYLPYSSHISPEIIKVKGGSYLMVFKITGVSYVGVNQELIDARVAQVAKFIAQLRAPYRFNCYCHTSLIKAPIEAYLDADFKEDSFADCLNSAYIETQIQSKASLSSDYYLAVIYRPYRRIGAFSGFKTTKKLIAEFENQAREVLGKIRSQAMQYFSDYGIRCLACYKNHKGVLFSEVLEYLSRICNLEESPQIPVMWAQISDYLGKAHISIGSNEYLQIEACGKKKFAAVLSFSEYPSEVRAGVLQDFLELPYQMIVSQSFQPIDKQEASGWLKREYNRLENTDSVTESELNDLAQAREGVVADNFLLGEYYFSAAIIADSIAELKQRLSEAQAVLSSCGFTATPFKMAKISAWFAQLPANIALQPRAAKLSSPNIAQIIPFQTHNRGKKSGNPWGQAISMLRTVSDEIYYFNFHSSPQNEDSSGMLALGNTIISGMSGAGKTVLLSFLLAQAQRYKNKPKTIIFDKDLGSSVFVKAMRGRYSQIQKGIPTGMNPFQLDNTPENRAFLLELMTTILEQYGKLTIKEVNTIAEKIEQTLLLGKEYASISAFSHYLSDGDNSLYQKILAWTTGEYAWVFNNPRDNFCSEDSDEFSLKASNLIGLDYTEFLDVPAIRTPILMYLLYQVELMLDGKPTIISLDEAWKPLSDPKFAKYIENKARTIRKQNGILLLTTQSPSDFFKAVPQAILEQIATQIFLPNPLAKREDYIEHLGLDEREYLTIRNMHPKSREFLIRQQGESSHCKLSLNIKEVDVLSGSAARAHHADRLIEQWGENWLEHYYQSVAEVGSSSEFLPDLSAQQSDFTDSTST